MNWYKISLNSPSPDNIFDVFDRILLGDNYNLYKQARVSSIPAQYEDNMIYWWKEKDKHIPWLMDKFDATEKAVTKVLNKYKANWQTFEQYRKEQEQEFVRLYEERKRKGERVVIKELAKEVGLPVLDAQKLFKQKGLSALGPGTIISENIKNRIVEIQQDAINRTGTGWSGPQIINQIFQETGTKISDKTVTRTLNKANLSLKGQRRDPRLSHLLSRFWETENKGFWNTLSNKSSGDILRIINNLIDKNISVPKDKELLKNFFFMENVQLRDALVQKQQYQPIPTKQRTWNPAQEKLIINLFNQGNDINAIAQETQIEPEIINNIVNTYQSRNFQIQYDESHPSYFLSDRQSNAMNWYKQLKLAAGKKSFLPDEFIRELQKNHNIIKEKQLKAGWLLLNPINGKRSTVHTHHKTKNLNAGAIRETLMFLGINPKDFWEKESLKTKEQPQEQTQEQPQEQLNWQNQPWYQQQQQYLQSV